MMREKALGRALEQNMQEGDLSGRVIKRNRSSRSGAPKSRAEPTLERKAAAQPSTTEANTPDEILLERRQLTVLFCDLVGSTMISASLDPEEESAVLREYHRSCADRITKAGGFVAQFQGDGVIGYFGYPKANENDAERAVRAALEVIETVPKIATEPGIVIQVRIGISTGIVVVGDPEGAGTRLEQTVIGDTVNLAARLQATADPNQIVIADSTKRLTGRLFACRDLGPLAMKGFAEPIRAWQVLAPSATTSQFETYREPVLTQMIGREAEIDMLMRKWQQTLGGTSQTVRVVAEAGMGKSRLIAEFRQRVAEKSGVWLEGGGSQFFQYTPFYAISQMILRSLDPAGRASRLELRAKLVRALHRAGLDLAQVLPPLTELLELPGTESFGPSTISPNETRDRLFAALIDWVHALARRTPLIIVVEDLHWVDASSLELIGRISKSPGPPRTLILLSMRVGFRWTVADSGSQHRLLLKRLPIDKLRQIVAGIGAGSSALSAEIVDKVVAKAGGVPLFAVELARLMVEQGASASDRRVPATLSDLLTNRLDRLGSAKLIAQVASVVGDEVSLALLGMVSQVSEASLQADLAKLIKAGLLQQSGDAANPVYSFKHALVRDAAYENLLKSRRRELHRRTAKALDEHHSALPTARPEVLAPHWAQGGEPHLAIKAWHQAGDAASARRAFKEAQQAYRGALSVLVTLPSSPEREAQELPILSSLAEVLRITRGYSAQETIDVTTQARALSEKNGDIKQQFLQAVGMWAAASSGGNYLDARQLADRVLALALVDRSEASLAHAHMIQMTSWYRIGNLVRAEDYFERGENYFQSPEFLKHPGWVAQTYGNAAINAWTMGNQVAAQQRVDKAISIARQNNSPYDLSFAECMAGIHAILTDSLSAAARFADGALRQAEKHGFPQFTALSRIILGRAMAGSGAPTEGIALINTGLAGMAKNGSRVGITRYMTWLAEAELLGGLLDDSLNSAEKALGFNPEELSFRPASLLLRGELYSRRGVIDKAEQDFRDAVDLSTQMGAKLFYDRATGSLQRLRYAPLV
jgi:class 3 adenylate cyclase/tetratricopeptide (TPR) repeat protein